MFDYFFLIDLMMMFIVLDFFYCFGNVIDMFYLLRYLESFIDGKGS